MRTTNPMVPIMKKTALALVVSALILPVSAHAAIKAGSVELSPFIGYNFFESQQNLEDSRVYGGRLGYNITPHFGVEGVGELIKTRVDDRSQPFTAEGQFTSPRDKVRISTYHLDLLYHFMPERSFNPFIAVGYGASHYNPEINTRDMAIFDLGVGAKYWMMDNLAMRVDFRDHLLFDERIHNLQATVGIVVAFGGKSKPLTVAKYEPEPKPQPRAVPKYEAKPVAEPTPPPPPAPVVEKKKVVILASEPEVEKKVQEAVAPPKAADKVLFEQAEPKIIILAFEDVNFDFDQSTLKPEAKTILKRNIQLLKDNPQAQIRVAGYTSASGSEEYNQKLSERRASSVKAYLIDEGIIDAGRLSTIGYGEDDPAYFEAAPKQLYSDAAKANMRVLFEIIVR